MSRTTRVVLVLTLLAPQLARGYSAGIFDRSTAGCTGNGCHSTVASPTTRVCISGLPPDATYVPNTTYSLTVFVDGFGIPPAGLTDPNKNLAGFDLSASAGVLGKDASDSSLRFPVFGESPNLNQLVHTFTGNKRNHWSLTWTAPASGNATLNLAGNAVNGSNAADSLDLWNTTSVSLTAGAGTGAGTGIFCNPPIPLPQLVPVPPGLPALSAH
jgi:hypothetical protein